MQTNFAIISVNQLNDNFSKSFNTEILTEDHITLSYEFWYFLQNYVISLGNISKLLFAGKRRGESQNDYKRRRKQRDILYKVLKVKAGTVLKSKKIRNTLEHIDEKLEDFAEIDPNIIVNKVIMPSVGGINIDGVDYYKNEEENLRSYFTDKKEFFLFGNKFDVESTFSEIIQLRDNII